MLGHSLLGCPAIVLRHTIVLLRPFSAGIIAGVFYPASDRARERSLSRHKGRRLTALL